MITIEALFKITYGLYLVCSGDRDKGNGYVSNTVFQVTASPAKFATCCNKNNLTAEYIRRSGAFSVSILEQNASSELIGTFGYQSGKDVDKMATARVKYADTGVPIVLNDSIAYFECKVVDTVDVGTHLMFIGELVSAELIDDAKEPLTYQYYRAVKKGAAPKNAPTYIDKSLLGSVQPAAQHKKYECLVCGYVYDDAVESIPFADLPADWSCPVCGAEKTDFTEILP